MPGTNLVTPERLREHLDDPDWVLLDCRHALADAQAGRRFYDAGYLPGAQFVDFETELTGRTTGSNGRHPLPDAAEFARTLERFGVGEGTQVVAYDAGADMFAARLWFLCKWIGHDAVALLDGGYAAWCAAGYPVQTAPPPARPAGTLRARVRPELTADATEVLARLQSPSMLLLDARSAERFAGRNESVDPVAGHIPGARNRPFSANFDERGRFKAPGVLRAEFLALGAGEPARIVHQCGSGVSAAVNLLAMEEAGLSGARLYPGSWSEWIADPSRPVVSG